MKVCGKLCLLTDALEDQEEVVDPSSMIGSSLVNSSSRVPFLSIVGDKLDKALSVWEFDLRDGEMSMSRHAFR